MDDKEVWRVLDRALQTGGDDAVFAEMERLGLVRRVWDPQRRDFRIHPTLKLLELRARAKPAG